MLAMIAAHPRFDIVTVIGVGRFGSIAQMIWIVGVRKIADDLAAFRHDHRTDAPAGFEFNQFIAIDQCGVMVKGKIGNGAIELVSEPPQAIGQGCADAAFADRSIDLIVDFFVAKLAQRDAELDGQWYRRAR